MKTALLAWLAAPCCRGELRLVLTENAVRSGDDIEKGALACVGCGRQYPVLDGVPRFSEDESDARVAKTRDSFAWEWKRYPGSLNEDQSVFLEECQLKAADFKGKLVLDAGCGMGRYALVAHSLGAEVVAVDLSESLLRLTGPAAKRAGLHVVQGNLQQPPFREGVFDLVYSHGVLHHTSDARKSFQKVAALVKPRGHLSVWLYGKAGRFEEFATNPIRSNRAWISRHRRLAWLIVALRHIFSDAVRLLTTRLPLPAAYALCYPLTWLGSVPGLKYLTFSVHPNFKVRLIENFDWISPVFQSHHTKEELSSWFREAGFEIVKILPHGLVPKPGVLGRKHG